MNTADIPAKLIALQTALVEKIEGQPYLDVSIMIRQSGKCSMTLYGLKYDNSHCIRGDTAEETFAAVAAYIAAMPAPEVAAKRNWKKSLGKVIDEGHALNLPDDVMAPLRTGSQAMASNLLPAP